MSPFPPEVANSMALDAAMRFMESPPPGTSMTIYWFEQDQEWVCNFVTSNDTHYEGRNFNIAKAIFDAIDQAPQ